MEDSHRSFSSATASAAAELTSPESQRQERHAREMTSEEIKENDQKLCGGVEMGRRNLKEEPKNAVSNITIALQRKVLTEKNDAPPSACSGTNSEGNPEVKKPGQVHCHPYAAAPEVASFPSMVQSHRAGEETVVSSEMQTYDPLTNYLSPRPKFLRYNPNKRQEIYHRRQRGRKGAKGSLGFDLCGSFEAGSPSSDKSPSDRVASPSMKQETSSVKRIHGKETSGGVEEAEEHDIAKEEEEEEEMPSACNPVWKCLLLFGVLFFSTCYITSSHPWPDVSCLQDFLLSKGNLFESKDFSHKVADNVGRNLNSFTSLHMNTCMQGHFNELADWAVEHINRLDSLLEYGVFGHAKLQEEGNLETFWTGSVISETNLTMMEGKIDESEESPEEGKPTIAERSDILIASVLVAEEGTEEYASEPKETQNDKNILKIEDDHNTGGDNEESSEIVQVHDLEHENGPVTDEEHVRDVFMGTNLGEKDDATDQKSETAPAKQENISDHEEESVDLENKLDITLQPSFPKTMEGTNALRFHGFRPFTIVLVVLAVAAWTIIGLLKFWRMPKTSTRDSSGSFPSPGMVSDGRNGTKVANTKKMKDKDSDVLAKADYHKKDNYEDQAPTVKLAVERKGKGLKYLVDEDKCRKVHESYTPSMKLLDDRFGITDLDTARYNDPCERNPPAVKLLGEFSITEQGMSETKNPSLWRKNFKIEELHSLPQEMLRRKSSPMIEEANQTSPEALPHESAICITPAPKEPTRKQGGNHKQEAEKLASTPVRRSSRIRHRVTSPKT